MRIKKKLVDYARKMHNKWLQWTSALARRLKKDIVAVLGISPKPARYSHKAIVALRKAGHRVSPINLGQSEIDGLSCCPDLSACPDTIATNYKGACPFIPC